MTMQAPNRSGASRLLSRSGLAVPDARADHPLPSVLPYHERETAAWPCDTTCAISIMDDGMGE